MTHSIAYIPYICSYKCNILQLQLVSVILLFIFSYKCNILQLQLVSVILLFIISYKCNILQLQLVSVILLFLQALWQLLWVNHTSSANSVRSIPVRTSSKKLSIEAIQQRVSIVVSELLSQVEQWKQSRLLYSFIFPLHWAKRLSWYFHIVYLQSHLLGLCFLDIFLFMAFTVKCHNYRRIDTLIYCILPETGHPWLLYFFIIIPPYCFLISLWRISYPSCNCDFTLFSLIIIFLFNKRYFEVFLTVRIFLHTTVSSLSRPWRWTQMHLHPINLCI